MSIQNLGNYRGHDLLTSNPTLALTLQVFDGISNHPRPSKEEEAVRAHLEALARTQGWEVKRDGIGNLAIRVKASPGKEDVTPVVMQGHMDIVTFPGDEQSPRQAEIIDKGEEGDERGLWMQTVGQAMTLGSDNGIGVSMAFALMMDPTLEHGPVTILLTVDEESGMSGAKNLDPDLLPETGILLNFDSEEGSTKICIGCAGSGDTVASFPIGDREALPEGHLLLDLELKDFPGGHSGVEIHKGRGNAIQSLAELLCRFQTQGADLRVVSIDGGQKRNAIPNSARARIAVAEGSAAFLPGVIEEFLAEIKTERAVENPTMTGELLSKNARGVTAHLTPTESVEAVGAFSADFQARVLAAIIETPQGPSQSAELPNVGELVTVSNNLGLVETKTDGFVELASMSRAARIEEMRTKMEEIRSLYASKGADVKQEEPTAGWLEDPDTSAAVSVVMDAVREAAGEAELMAYHAGLEAGLVAGKARGSMSAVSVGPLIVDAHTRRERVKLSSVADVLTAMRKVFERITNIN